MNGQLTVAPSPQLRNPASKTSRIMLDVIIAMIPAVLASLWFFGWAALKILVISVGFAVLSEFVYQKITHQESTVCDLSAAVTGILLAFNLPSNAPWWMPAIGAILAIVLVKQMFGGLGHNFVNPALAARTILMLSWAGLIAAKAPAIGGQIFGQGKELVDTVAGATPLVNSEYSLWDLFIGNVPGMLGETSKLALLLGGVYLVIRGVIDWRTPVAFIASAFVLFFIKTGDAYAALYQILAGGLILGAVFMATDYVTSPISKWGHVIMGLGCAILLFVIRAFNKGYPEGCSYAILFMNILTPFIDKLTAPKPFGAVKAKK